MSFMRRRTSVTGVVTRSVLLTAAVAVCTSMLVSPAAAAPMTAAAATGESLQVAVTLSGSPAKVLTFAHDHGLHVDLVTRRAVLLSGPADQAAAAFATRLHRVPGRWKHDTSTYVAAVSKPGIPADLRGTVTDVVGLDNRPFFQHRAIPFGYTGPQLNAAYGATSLTGAGAGITVGTVQFSAWNPSDASTYAGAAGISLGASQITTVPVAGAPTTTDGSGGDVEVALDVEAVMASAPRAAQRVYVAPNSSAGAVAVYSKVADDAAAGLVQVVSTSWGGCEADYSPDLLQQLGTIIAGTVSSGATTFASSGDSGAYDCAVASQPDGTLAVDFPGSAPAAVSVGGTRLISSGGGYVETGWGPAPTTTAATTFPGVGSGGGASSVYPRPSYQSSLTTPGTTRSVPDVSSLADASTGFGAYASSAGGWHQMGGTSLAAPLWAGQLAAALSTAGRSSGLGDIHAALYAHPQAFRDILSGANGYYTAGPGYDQVTGLGSPQWSSLYGALGLNAPAPTSTPTPTPTVTATPTPTPVATTPAPVATTAAPAPTTPAPTQTTAAPSPTAPAPAPVLAPVFAPVPTLTAPTTVTPSPSAGSDPGTVSSPTGGAVVATVTSPVAAPVYFTPLDPLVTPAGLVAIPAGWQIGGFETPVHLDLSLQVSALPAGALLGDVHVIHDGTVVPACSSGAAECVDTGPPVPGLLSYSVTGAGPGGWSFAVDEVARLAGADRVATAVAVSQAAFPAGGAAAAVLARSDGYADALCGAPLAAAEGGPLLLTSSTVLSAADAVELTLAVLPGGSVYLLGGSGALSPAVADRVSGLGFHVVRLAGPDRFATAVAVAAALQPTGPVLLTTGLGFPDALAAGAAAAYTGGAVLLTAGDQPVAATQAYLASHPASLLYAVGGPAARAYPKASPVVGADRYATAVSVAGTFFPAARAAGIASGSSFPDALAAGPLLGGRGVPLLLTASTALPTSVVGYFASRHPATVHVFGGSAALGDGLVQQVRTAIG